MPDRLVLSTDDFNNWEIQFDGEVRKLWRDGNWQLTSSEGDIRVGSRNLNWGGALERAVELLKGE